MINIISKKHAPLIIYDYCTYSLKPFFLWMKMVFLFRFRCVSASLLLTKFECGEEEKGMLLKNQNEISVNETIFQVTVDQNLRIKD